jgi:predicted histone-like DNA-binding protein
MAVEFKVVQKVNPQDPTAPRKYYASLSSPGEISLRGLCEEIADGATVTTTDTYAVLEGLLRVLPRHLAYGRIIRLGEFGSFRLTLKSEGLDTEDEVNASSIKSAKLIFKPGNVLKNTMLTLRFNKARA